MAPTAKYGTMATAASLKPSPESSTDAGGTENDAPKEEPYYHDTDTTNNEGPVSQDGNPDPLTLEESSAPVLVHSFEDHFSLLMPSSKIRFQLPGSGARVYELEDGQIVLEEDEKHRVTVKQMEDKGVGATLLRLVYTIVCAFWVGFLFVFSLQVLLFVTLDLAIQLGITSKQDPNYAAAVGVFASYPGFVYGLSSGLVIGGAFIQDVWRGHSLLRNFAFSKIQRWIQSVVFRDRTRLEETSVVAEWIFFFFFLGLPIVTMCGLMLAINDDWWAIGGIVWLASVFCFFVIFCVSLVSFEMRMCYNATKACYFQDTESPSLLQVATTALFRRQEATYSGTERKSFISKGILQSTEATDRSQVTPIDVTKVKVSKSPLACLTLWKTLSTDGGLGLYEKEEKQVYTIDDVRDVRSFMTAYSWSLERVFCTPLNSRYVTVVDGDGEITKAQIDSTKACSFVGLLLMLSLLVSLLVYIDMGSTLVVLGFTVGALVVAPRFMSAVGLYGACTDLVDAQKKVKGTAQQGNPSQVVYFVRQDFRITRATARLCWIMFGLEVALGFLWPLVSLFAVRNYPLAILFIVFAGTTGLRYYLDVAVILQDEGNLTMITGDAEVEATEISNWRARNRVSEIVGKITRSKSWRPWMAALGFFGLVLVVLFAGALGPGQADNAETVSKTEYVYLPDFYYAQSSSSLEYPSCQLSNDLGLSPLKTMADYAFLAGLAYRHTGSTQAELDGWFNRSAFNNNDLVRQFKSEMNVSSAVSFKLITFPDSGNFAYVTIRGTNNKWDMLTDVQLWSAAKLLQLLRRVLPLGAIWTPIIPTMINLITTIESSNIRKISFYKDTTRFVQSIQASVPSTYAGIAVTGHSLGGGLAIITGAQTGVPAVGLSATNAMLSRKSFDPPITARALNAKTFNIIPDRDIVPRIDDVAQNFQNINCRPKTQDVIGCHDSTRSLCEIIFTCGTGIRPAICECVTKFNYPEPKPKPGTNRTFAEACANASDN